MKNEFATIDLTTLDTVTGGAPAGQVAKRAGAWAWNNVAKPLGATAAWDWASNQASNWTGGGQQQQQPQRTTGQ